MVPFDKMTKLQSQFFDFGDQRLNARGEKCLETLSKSNTIAGFPCIFEDQYDLKAFYRLMNNNKVTPDKIIAGFGLGLKAIIEEMAPGPEKEPEEFYHYQDTTYGSFLSRNKLDLGYLENVTDNGVVIHTALLTDRFFMPIGIPWQRQILRDRADYQKAHDRKSRPFKEKESYKWVESLSWSITAQKEMNIKIIHVADREGDMNDFFNYAFEHGLDFIVRSRHDRVLLGSDRKLKEYLRAQAAKAVVERQLLDNKGKPYIADCAIFWDTIQVQNTANTLQVIYLRQLNKLKEGQDAEWVMITSLPVDEEKQAVKILDIYTNRWRTCEDFHKCLKSGCSMEKRQFDSSHGMTNCIAMLSLTALHLLRMRHLAILDDEPVSKLLNNEECKLAEVLADRHLKPIDLTQCKPNTALWLVLILGRMGGHQGIKQRGLPGWKTLWLGWYDFKKLMDGVILSKNFFAPP